VDSELTDSHPEWFSWDSTGEVAHPFAMENGKQVVWGDLAQFDHAGTKDKEGLSRYFLRVLEFLTDLGFRGFRCDAAYQIPRRLWEKLIEKTKRQSPDALFFAETLGTTPERTRETARAGFDYIFNSSKWWDLEAPWLMKQYRLTRETAPSISFAESHDTVRLFEELGGSVEGVKQRYLFSALFSAGVMMPIGFEFGFRKKLHVVETTPKDWETTDVDLTAFISEVNRIKATYRVFQEEAVTEMPDSGNPNILLMHKRSEDKAQEALVILNKDIENAHSFHFPDLRRLLRSAASLADVSPEVRMDRVQAPFSRDLRPGQGIVLVTEGAPDRGGS
jgi:starch synthase (maltosyl-transferring)